MASTLPQEHDRVRRIRLYRNGDDNFFGKDFVLNPRQVRNYEVFLQSVTDHVQMKEAARAICTPVHGTRLKKLEDVEDRNDYVAVGKGKFKNIGYMSLQNRFTSKLQDLKKSKESFNYIPPVQHSRIQVSGRIKRIRNDVIQIYIFTNGEEMIPAKRVMLTEQQMKKFSLVLSEINQYVNPQHGATRILYNLNGTQVKSLYDIVNGGTYVAAGAFAAYKNVKYGASLKPVFDSSPKIRNVENSNQYMTPRQKTEPRMMEDRDSCDDGSNPKSSQSYPMRTKPRQFATTRTTERGGRLMTMDGKPIFPMKPVKHIRQNSRPKPVDYDRDEGGIFKAKTSRYETEGALEINDSGETRTELPFDLVDAEEVKDEQIEIENELVHVKHGKEERDNRSPMKTYRQFNGYRNSWIEHEKENDGLEFDDDNEESVVLDNGGNYDEDQRDMNLNSTSKTVSVGGDFENNAVKDDGNQDGVDEEDFDKERTLQIKSRQLTPHEQDEFGTQPTLEENSDERTGEERNRKTMENENEAAGTRIQSSPGCQVPDNPPLDSINRDE